jgi:hypothetical protein
MPLNEREGGCSVCSGIEPRTIDRLLLAGHGIRFVKDRWGHSRQDVKRHRDRCLVGDRRKRVEADLVRMSAGGGP